MRLTKKQKIDLDSAIEHIPSNVKFRLPPTDDEIKMYFEYSERGMHKDKALMNPAYCKFSYESFSGFNALTWGKSWRDTKI